ncbi:XRE family transcriptional regulator [Methylobacterium sp. J-090]|uniref:XRE family transcriptional regulator n=1 Tax=Methylobacterium sp. J-090 TaxID=2836666 RepID=UPI001FBBB8C7|nr:XRE family transcriptional regulator [Methylobacterium sp. J-090]MCJ2080724.1 helix-turn-helix domain-containing protein [Methylobacterium sp. J-090]
MSEHIAAILFEARKMRGLTQQQVADAVGVSRPAVGQWESGKKTPSTGHLMKLAQALGIRWERVATGDLVEDERPPGKRDRGSDPNLLLDEPLMEMVPGFWEGTAERRAKKAADRALYQARLKSNSSYSPQTLTFNLKVDLPVLGVSMGGREYDFSFNGRTMFHTLRPIGITNSLNAYATYVVGQSMTPAFREGTLIYVNPDRLPSIGDDVLIEIHPQQPDNNLMPGFIGRLVNRMPENITVEQFNPSKKIQFDAESVKSLHRIVPWNELIEG